MDRKAFVTEEGEIAETVLRRPYHKGLIIVCGTLFFVSATVVCQSAALVGCCDDHEEVVTEGLSVVEVLPIVSRTGDCVGANPRKPLELKRTVDNGRALWTGRYVERVGQGHVLHTVRIGTDGQESNLSSKPLDGSVLPKLSPDRFLLYLRLAGMDPASVSHVDFNPRGEEGVRWVEGLLWCGKDRVELSRELMWPLSVVDFTNRVAMADRIVIRGGGDESGLSLDENDEGAVLAEVSNASEVAAFNALLDFASPKEPCECALEGNIGVDWWKNGKRITRTVVTHGHLRGLILHDFPYFLEFTRASTESLTKWFEEKGLRAQ